MAYEINAIIGTLPLLISRSAEFTSAAVVPLQSGLALIPITDELLNEMDAPGDCGQFYNFTPGVAQWLRAISAAAPTAYVEAEFFGGVGGQSAVVWAGGEQLLAPTHEPEAINIALRLLGVSRGTSHDEFDAIGLPRHRHTNGWLADAIPKTRNS